MHLETASWEGRLMPAALDVGAEEARPRTTTVLGPGDRPKHLTFLTFYAGLLMGPF